MRAGVELGLFYSTKKGVVIAGEWEKSRLKLV